MTQNQRTFLRKVYRKFQNGFIKKILSRKSIDYTSINNIEKSEAEKRIWFHAASVGELESLTPLVFEAVQSGFRVILTIFSSSAELALEKLKEELPEKKGPSSVILAAFSPWEGEWSEAFRTLQPDLFVTSKYEAWPDLWASLKENRIPLAIISAKSRSSLQWARKLCFLFADGLPQLFLFPSIDSEVEALRSLFPEAWIQVGGEPRWDRVMGRMRRGNLRAKELIKAAIELPRPWGVLGSVWLEDLKFLKPLFTRAMHSSETFWIVPHKIEPKNISAIERFLKSLDLRWVKTSQIKTVSDLESNHGSFSGNSPCILVVDEMGFLSELYGAADWAFVGGGFGSGIHSTIEPAIHGIPIGGGPCGKNKFSEIEQLLESKQLTILNKDDDLMKWFEDLHCQFSTQKHKKSWIKQAQDRGGVSKNLLSVLTEATLKIPPL